MIRAASAYTYEIDDIPLACGELKTQLNSKLKLMRNTVGIVQCNSEFVEAGIMGPLFKELNIPLVGGTTVSSAANDAVGGMMFSLLVLTSDDVVFVTSHTKGFMEDYSGAIGRSLAEALSESRECRRETLKLVIVFPPVMDSIAGDCYIDAIGDVCGTAPVFGTLCVDDSLSKFDRSAAVYNGTAFKCEMSYVLLFGDVNPRFSVATVPRQSSLTRADAVITRAGGNVVYEINDMSALDYFESVGLAAGRRLKDGAVFIPLLMRPSGDGGGVPFVRALIRVDRDGSAVFRGRMIEGAACSFGSGFGEDVLTSTEDLIKQIQGEDKANAALLFSCIIRQLVIGADPLRELSLVKGMMPCDIPFIASYAGGEISPIRAGGENTAQNRFHNYSFIACLLS